MATITLNNRTLQLLDEGTGDDLLVLIHAVPLDAAMWQPQAEGLTHRCRVVAADLAGFGGSDPLEDSGDSPVERWADDIIDLLTTLGADRVTLVGASVGADVALSVVRRARDAVGALGLAGLRGPLEPAEAANRIEEAAWIAGGGDRNSIVDRLVDELVGAASSRRGEVVKLVRWMLDRTPVTGWQAGLTAMAQRPDPRPDLDKIDVPTLLLAGGQDQLSPPDATAEITARIPGAGMIEVPDAGHLANLENPAVFNRALEDLLDGRQARRSPGKHSWPASPASSS